MKKIFTLLTAILFAGSMMAAEVVTFDFDSIATANNWENGKAYSPVTVAPITITAKGGGNNAKYYTSDKSWRMYSGGSLEITAASGYEVSEVTSSPSVTFTVADGKATASFTAAIRFTSITVSYKEEDPTKPVLLAENLDFGKGLITKEEANFVLDTTLAVTGANLSAAIEATGTENVAVSGELTATGGTLNLHIVAAPGEFNDTILLTSGDVTRKVAISGLVIQTTLAPGTPAKMTADNSKKSYDATVNGVYGIKAGTSSDPGTFTITVAAKAAKLHFFAAAWTGESGTISLSAPEGVTLSATSVDVTADSGISGSSNDYLLKDLEPEDCLSTIDLTGVEAETLITVTGANRFVVWGATYELGGETGIFDTNVEGKTVKFMENGQIVILKNGVRFNVLGAQL